MALKWGIIGASKISHDFCEALKCNLTDIKHEVIAIASRSAQNAELFAKSHKIATSYGSYDLLMKDKQVEIVYITVLNPQHFEVCKLAIENGKHVLCEKPFAMNKTQAQKLFALAKKNIVFLMEGLWSRFFPVYNHMSHLNTSGQLGIAKEVYIKHGFIGYGNDRIEKKALGGGIVLDIGCYAIQFALFVFREAPTAITASGKVNKDGVDLYFEAELTFPTGKAFLVCSGLEILENQATVITTKGPVCVPQYWCPTKYIALEKLYEWDFNLSSNCNFNYTNSAGLKYEADEVAKCIRAGKTQCEIATPEESVLIASIQDEIRKQIGVSYECDKDV